MSSDRQKPKLSLPLDSTQTSPDEVDGTESLQHDAVESAEAVETFVLEVSAGKPSAASKAIDGKAAPRDADQSAVAQRRTNPPSPAKSPSPAAAAKRSTQVTGPGQMAIGNRAEAKSPRTARIEKKRKTTRSVQHQRAVISLDQPPAELQINAGKQRLLRNYFRGLSPLGVSLFLHVCALLLLSFLVLSIPSSEDVLGLYASTAPEEETVDFSEIEIDPTEDFDEMSENFSADLFDPGASSFGELSAESALADVGKASDSMPDSLGEIGALFGEDGQGLADMGLGKEGATASFFGTRVEAMRILYLLDNSGSMHSGRLETMIFETIKSVNVLSPKQQFYVIFYSDTVYPLFYPRSATEFVRATDKNKQRLIQWLDTVEMYSGNAVDEAILAATSIRPDVVYFLTDGDVNTTKDGRKLRALLDNNGRSFAIHTFGMGTGSSEEFEGNLRSIAEANGGTYRSVAVTPEMRELARRHPRTYHKNNSK